VLQFLGLIVNGVRQNHKTDQIASTVVSRRHREVLSSIQGGFFRDFGQFNGAGLNSETSSGQTVEICFYCNHQGNFARTSPHK
jgi:hypothetical protein